MKIWVSDSWLSHVVDAFRGGGAWIMAVHKLALAVFFLRCQKGPKLVKLSDGHLWNHDFCAVISFLAGCPVLGSFVGVVHQLRQMIGKIPYFSSGKRVCFTIYTPPSPEIPQKSQKGHPGPPRPECQESVEKAPKHWFSHLFDSFFGSLGLLRHFFDLSSPKSQRFLRFAIAMPIADPEIASDLRDKRKQCCIAI